MLEASIYNPQDKQKMAEELKIKTRNSQTVYMCIGTEKVFSDSLGPRVGSLLNENMLFPAFVYGLCEQNITAENLLYSYNFIKALHPDSTIVVIDAAVGTTDQIGKIQLCDGGILPGAATNKNLPSVGDVGIIGIVAEKGMNDFYTLNSSKDRLVGQIAQFIADVILVATKSVS
ncbi:MAG: spore protease YyaC [Clostridiales bacterium]|nr:spore protease YyaC [Clostridiales bacterium]